MIWSWDERERLWESLFCFNIPVVNIKRLDMTMFILICLHICIRYCKYPKYALSEHFSISIFRSMEHYLSTTPKWWNMHTHMKTIRLS